VVAVPAFQLGIPALLPLGVAVTSIPAIYLAGTLFSSLPGVVLVERAPVWRCFSLIRRRWWGTVGALRESSPRCSPPWSGSSS